MREWADSLASDMARGEDPPTSCGTEQSDEYESSRHRGRWSFVNGSPCQPASAEISLTT